jgi:hypothetical protein
MFGRTVLSNNSVFPTRVSADGSPKYKAGGGTIDWSTVTAVSGSDATLPGRQRRPLGQKYLRYGQVVCKITTGETQTITGTATSGSGTLTLVRPDTGATVTTAAIAFNATAATVLAAIQAVMGPGQAVSASGGALGTAPVVITFSTSVDTMTVNAGTLAGGTFAVAATTDTGLTGYFGPYDPAATDGRQNLNRGDCFVLRRDGPAVLVRLCRAVGPSNDQVGGLIEGGEIWIDRVLQSGTAAHTLALGPTLARVPRRLPAVLARKELTRVLTPPIFRSSSAPNVPTYSTHTARRHGKRPPSTDRGEPHMSTPAQIGFFDAARVTGVMRGLTDPRLLPIP